MKETVEFPNNLLVPKGKITIDVFDESSGEIKLSKKKDNYVNKRVLRYASVLKQYQNFQSDFSSDRFFNAVLLTDSSDEINQNFDSMVKGGVVGYGSITSQVATTVRGAYNPSESILSDFYYKLVFDFPTSSANGTFQSIYTAKLGDVNNPLSHTPSFTDSLRIKGNETSRFPYLFINGYVYRYEGSSVNKYKTPVWKTGNVTDVLTLELLESHPLPHPINGLTCKDDYFYYLDGIVVKKAHVSSPAISTVVKTLTLPSSSSTGFAYSAKHDKFYVWSWSDDSLHTFDSSFNKLSVHRHTDLGSVGYPPKSSMFQMNWSAQNPDYLLFPFHSRVNLNTMKAVSNSSGVFNALNGLPAFIPNSSENINDVYISSPEFFSRVLLDSPVTKTSTQTMKITYEFTVPSLDLMSI